MEIADFMAAFQTSRGDSDLREMSLQARKKTVAATQHGSRRT
jgi:hypothetical protein